MLVRLSAAGKRLGARLAPVMDRIHAYLERLTVRERRVLMILVFFLAVVFLWLLVWRPVDQWSERAHEALVQERELQVFLAANYGRAKDIAGRQRATHFKDAAAVVASTGRMAGLDLARVQPGRQGVVSVWIDSVPWNKLLPWLVQLHNRERLEVRQIRIERSDQKGIVKVFIRLSR